MLHSRGRINTLATHTNHKELLMAQIAMVVVCNVIMVMKNSMEKLLAKVAFMWAGRIIDMRHLAINVSCTMKLWWSIHTTLRRHGAVV
jgi:hypothetical protein